MRKNGRAKRRRSPYSMWASAGQSLPTLSSRTTLTMLPKMGSIFFAAQFHALAGRSISLLATKVLFLYLVFCVPSFAVTTFKVTIFSDAFTNGISPFPSRMVTFTESAVYSRVASDFWRKSFPRIAGVLVANFSATRNLWLNFLPAMLKVRNMWPLKVQLVSFQLLALISFQK